MAETTYTSTVYRLRAGSPMPVLPSGKFVLHTFMAEKNEVDMISCTTELPGSEEFRGQGGTYMSASFSRVNAKGGTVFNGKIVKEPSYVEEDDI